MHTNTHECGCFHQKYLSFLVASILDRKEYYNIREFIRKKRTKKYNERAHIRIVFYGKLDNVREGYIAPGNKYKCIYIILCNINI